MDSIEIRTLVIKALFSDDKLMQQLALKGGSALELVHKVVSRGSYDIDLSMSGESEDPADAESRLFRALRDRFDPLSPIARRGATSIPFCSCPPAGNFRPYADCPPMGNTVLYRQLPAGGQRASYY